MLKNRKIGAIKQVDKELKKVTKIKSPQDGWINSIRRLLNMSRDQLGKLANLSGQGIYALEKREREDKITLQKLRKIAWAFDMELVYAFVPHSSLEDMIERRALEKAKEIVKRSDQNMQLEAQQVDKDTLLQQIKEISQELKNSLNSTLWQ